MTSSGQLVEVKKLYISNYLQFLTCESHEAIVFITPPKGVLIDNTEDINIITEDNNIWEDINLRNW